MKLSIKMLSIITAVTVFATGSVFSTDYQCVTFNQQVRKVQASGFTAKGRVENAVKACEKNGGKARDITELDANGKGVKLVYAKGQPV